MGARGSREHRLVALPSSPEGPSGRRMYGGSGISPTSEKRRRQIAGAPDADRAEDVAEAVRPRCRVSPAPNVISSPTGMRPAPRARCSAPITGRRRAGSTMQHFDGPARGALSHTAGRPITCASFATEKCLRTQPFVEVLDDVVGPAARCALHDQQSARVASRKRDVGRSVRDRACSRGNAEIHGESGSCNPDDFEQSIHGPSRELTVVRAGPRGLMDLLNVLPDEPLVRRITQQIGGMERGHQARLPWYVAHTPRRRVMGVRVFRRHCAANFPRSR
jgi:hypothetical protein